MKSLLMGLMLMLPVAANADWGFLPVMDSDYVMAPRVSAKYGSLKGTDAGSEAITMMGLELSLTCPLLKGPMPIRQQVSYNTGSKSTTGADFTVTSIELNPHMMFDVAENLKLGVGPGFGYLMSKADSSVATVNQSYGALQLGASADYAVIATMHAGFEYRYQYTEQVDGGANNTAWALKFGMDL